MENWEQSPCADATEALKKLAILEGTPPKSPGSQGTPPKSPDMQSTHTPPTADQDTKPTSDQDTKRDETSPTTKEDPDVTNKAVENPGNPTRLVTNCHFLMFDEHQRIELNESSAEYIIFSGTIGHLSSSEDTFKYH
jgi:hypothetical protein